MQNLKKSITIGGKPYDIALTKRAQFRFEGLAKPYNQERGDFRRLCIALWAMIMDKNPPDPEDIAEVMTDAEIKAASDALESLVVSSEKDAEPSPLSESGHSASVGAV